MPVPTLVIILVPIGAAIVTFLLNIIRDSLLNRKPELCYAVKEASSIPRNGQKIGAYEVFVTNVSSKTIKQVSVNIQAEGTTLQFGTIEPTQGLKYHVSESSSENNLEIVVPFIQAEDFISIQAIAESSTDIPKKPSVKVRSPQDPIVTVLSEPVTRSRYRIPALLGAYTGIITAISIGIFFVVETGSLWFVPKEHVLVRAAESSGLQDLVEKYATYDALLYYPQALLAYSKARTTQNTTEMKKYRDFLNLVLEYGQNRIPKMSQCAIHYYIAKIELLLNNPSTAYMHLSKAREADRGHFQELMKHDPEVTSLVLQREPTAPQASP